MAGTFCTFCSTEIYSVEESSHWKIDIKNNSALQWLKELTCVEDTLN